MKSLKLILTLMLVFSTSLAFAQFSNGGGSSKTRGGNAGTGDYNKSSFRIQAGLNVSSATIGGDYYDGYNKKSKVGFNIGFRYDKQFNRYFAIQTGLDYTLKGVKTILKDSEGGYWDDDEYWDDWGLMADSYYDDEETSEEYKTVVNIHYLQIPILAGIRYDFNGKVPVQLQFNTGPYIGIGIAGKAKTSSNAEGFEDYSQKVFGDIDKNKDAKRIEDEVLGLKRFDMGWRFDIGADINKFYVGLAYDLGFLDIQNKKVKEDIEKYKGKYEALHTGNFSINVGYRF